MIELLLAIALTTGAVVMISLTFPKSSASLTNVRHRSIAHSFADSRIQELRAQAYPYIPVNPQSDFDLVANPNCDCALVNIAALPTTDGILEDSGITFTRKVCINFAENVGGVWTSYCPGALGTAITSAQDKGLKNIRVRVSWALGVNSYSTDSESLVAR